MELETRNSQLQEELATAPSKRPSASSPDWTPRAPARYTLSGHRSPITRVTFHPLFNVVVSASEDSSIKVYDWETGEFERTVKGHTKAVQDVDFDSMGNLLGESLLIMSCAMPRLNKVRKRHSRRDALSFVFVGFDLEVVGHEPRMEERADPLWT